MSRAAAAKFKEALRAGKRPGAARGTRKKVLGAQWGNKGWEAGYFYHVTFARNLPSIRKVGLQPEREGISHGNTFLTEHSKGKVFVSTWLGIKFWADSAADIAMQLAEDPCEAELVPVLLRVPASTCVTPDLPGWKDSRAEAFVTGPIAPEVIEIFGGRSAPIWYPLSEIDALDIAEGCVVETSPYGKSVVMVLEAHDSPLMPGGLPDSQR